MMKFVAKLIGTVLALFIVCLILFPVGFGGKEASKKTACLSNTKQMALGILMYAEQNDGVAPKSDRWMDSIQNLEDKDKNVRDLDRAFHDPVLFQSGGYGYAYRKQLSGSKISQVKSPAEYILVFDSVLTGKNASSDLSSMPRPGRHDGVNMASYLDGHAKRIKDQQ